MFVNDRHLSIELKKPEMFVRETLNRMGSPNKDLKTLTPYCYLLNVNNEYFVMHYKELLPILYKEDLGLLTEDDIIRRNSITFLLKKWGLVDVDDNLIESHQKHIFVIKYNDKNSWKIKHKFNINLLNEYEEEIKGW